MGALSSLPLEPIELLLRGGAVAVIRQAKSTASILKDT